MGGFFRQIKLLKKKKKKKVKVVKLPNKKVPKNIFPTLSESEKMQIQKKVLRSKKDKVLYPPKPKPKPPKKRRVFMYIDDEGDLVRGVVEGDFDPNNSIWRSVLFQAIMDNFGKMHASCKAIGVPVCKMYHLFDKDPEFEKWFRTAQDRAIDLVEDELKRRAIDGYSKAIWYRGRVVGKEKVYSDQCLIKLMSAYRKRYVTSSFELSGKEDSHIKIDHGIFDKILVDERVNSLIHELLTHFKQGAESNTGGVGISIESRKMDISETLNQIESKTG